MLRKICPFVIGNRLQHWCNIIPCLHQCNDNLKFRPTESGLRSSSSHAKHNSKMADTDGACRVDRLAKLKAFSSLSYHRGVVQRSKPHASADDFFDKLKQVTSFDEMMGKVRKKSAKEDIRKILAELILEKRTALSIAHLPLP